MKLPPTMKRSSPSFLIFFKPLQTAWFVALLALAGVPIFKFPSGTVAAPTDASQTSALMDMYANMGGNQWTTSTNWTVGDPCGMPWFGVMCDPTKTVVISLSLTSNKLTGNLVTNIGNLTALSALEVGLNSITGSLSATSFSALSSLM